MDTSIDKTQKDEIVHLPTHIDPPARRRLPIIDIFILCAIALAAFVPRLILATQLDVVTDEVVYIQGGKTYLPLLLHLQIRANGWTYNYEHPPFVKLLIGLSIAFNTISHPLGELLAARIPSILFGTLLVVAVYLLARAPFGRIVALLGALCLAFSPWLVYFSALAYLDMTMTALITIAFLLLYHAIRKPWLYLIVAALVGLAIASKYTASLATPGMLLFLIYYFRFIRPRLPLEQQPALPWRWWLGAMIVAPLTFFAADPAIWPNPIIRLVHSFSFEWTHSINGHLTFLAGQYSTHVPHWAILYIISTKMSAFVTISAAFFALFALIQLIRFHRSSSQVPVADATALSFLLIWLLAILGMFSLLNIVVGTHYHLPLAPPTALAAAAGLTILLRYRRSALFTPRTATESNLPRSLAVGRARINVQAAITLLLLTLLLAGPHLLGLLTVRDAEGYTNEFFGNNENSALQVAYPGYRDAVQWLATHTSQPAHIGLVALPDTLGKNGNTALWSRYNADLPARFTINEAHPNSKTYPYDYLVWPMHLIQRGYPIPPSWRVHSVDTVVGGNTIYCYVLANPAMLSP